jgi:fructosamine-3-kinase
VEKYELLDSRWNGNEVFKYTTDKGLFFIKLNRVEDPSVFLSEAVGLSAIAATNTLPCPKPLHLGKLPKVGDCGPGAFMVLDHLKLLPFGIMRSDMQQRLGKQLAEMHLDQTHAALHKGRFGFAVSNFLALTPLNNTWTDDWSVFFSRRLEAQVRSLYEDKQYGRAALNDTDTELLNLGLRVVQNVEMLLMGVEVKPSLIHGDLWIGNAGATEAGPVIFDPACFFGHHEMELAMATLFGGFRDEFWNAYHEMIPKEKGWEVRHKLYQFYYYLNQLNLFGDAGVKRTCLRLAEELLLV